jgi:hypothetical protein
MVRYLPDRWQVGLTMNGKSNGCNAGRPFALRPTCRLQGAGRYRRVNGTFYEFIIFISQENFYPKTYFNTANNPARSSIIKTASFLALSHFSSSLNSSRLN